MALSVFELNQRSRDIFREIVDAYMETGEPVGSRTLSKRLATQLSPATIRNIMADLEEAGLLYAPHVSAGRLPTEEGLRFFVHGLLEVGDIDAGERQEIENLARNSGKSVEAFLEQASSMLAGLSQCAGVVLAPKTESILRHIEFVYLGTGRALVILISQDGLVENRLIELPSSITPDILKQASNYLGFHVAGRTLQDAKRIIDEELSHDKNKLDQLTTRVVETGMAVWAGGHEAGALIVKGQSHLLQNVTEVSELEQIRHLFSILEAKEGVQHLLDAAIEAQGIQIYIGANNTNFNISGCSIVVSPYHNLDKKIIGAIGVVGPTRMNYSRIIPLVDYTAKIVGKLLTGHNINSL